MCLMHMSLKGNICVFKASNSALFELDVADVFWHSSLTKMSWRMKHNFVFLMPTSSVPTGLLGLVELGCKLGVGGGQLPSAHVNCTNDWCPWTQVLLYLGV